MLKLKKIAVAAVGGVVLMAASASYALPTFTSGSFAFGAVTTSTADVTTATSFPLVPDQITPNVATGDFTLVVLPATLAFPAGAADFTLVGCCNWSDPNLGSFVGNLLPHRTQTTPPPNASATWDVEGLFTVGPAFTNAGAVLSANQTWSLTQTGGPGNSTSISGSFNSPSRTQIPEPATLALIGLGIAGLGFARRRKVS